MTAVNKHQIFWANTLLTATEYCFDVNLYYRIGSTNSLQLSCPEGRLLFKVCCVLFLYFSY